MPAFQRLTRLLFAWVVMVLGAGAALAQPVFDASVSPSPISQGSATTLTYTITNTSGVPVSNNAFSTTLPAGLSFLGSPTVSSSCSGATVNAPSGGSTLTFADAAIAPGDSCGVSLVLTAASSGIFTIVSGDLTSDAGNSGTASVNLDVSSPTSGPLFSKSVSPSSIAINDTARLTYTIDNSANASDFGAYTIFGTSFVSVTSSAGFSETLPAGVTMTAAPNFHVSGCYEAPAGFTVFGVLNNNGSSGSNISVSGLIVEAGQTCTISMDVRASSADLYELLSDELTLSSGGSFGRSYAELAVTGLSTATPQLQKFFSPDTVNPGGTTTLEFYLSNGDRNFAATDLSFTDDLDAMLSGATLVASSIPANPCGAGSTISGTSTIAFSGGTLPAGSNCSFSVEVAIPATAAGATYPNTTSTLTATMDGNPVTGSTATDTLTVRTATVPQPVFAKEFTDDPATPGDQITLRYTIDNSASAVAVTELGFTDVLDFLSAATGFVDGGSVVSAASFSNLCGSGSSVVANISNSSNIGFGPAITLSNGNIAAGASCTFDVVLQTTSGESPGSYPSTSGLLSYNDGTSVVSGGTASDTLVFSGGANLSFSKGFGQASAKPGDTVQLTFTIESAAESLSPATGLAFTDDLNAFHPGATFASLSSDTCGGAGVGAVSDPLGTPVVDGVFSYSGGTVAPGNSCSVTIDVLLGGGAAPNADITNIASALTGTAGGEAVTAPAATADLFVGESLPFTVEMSYPGGSAIPGETITVDFSLTNPNSLVASADGSVNFAAGLAGMDVTSLPAAGFCGGASTASEPIAGFLVLSTMQIPSNGSCSFSAQVLVPAGAPDGAFNPNLGVTGTVGGQSFTVNSAPDLIIDSVILTLAKSFADATVKAGDATDVTYTITNPSAQTVTAIAFTDDLGAFLSGTTLGSSSTTCGGTVAGTSVLGLSGASLAPGGSCTVDATLQTVSSAPSGPAVNTTGLVTGDVGGVTVSGVAASDTINVSPDIDLTLAKSFADPAVPAGGSTTLTLTIANTSAVASAADVSVSDNLGAMLSGVIGTGLSASADCGGTFSGTSTLTFSGGNIAAGDTCTLTATVVVPGSAAPGSYSNTTSQLFLGGLAVQPAATAVLSVEPAPTFAKVFGPDVIAVDQGTTLTFTIDNSASAIAAGSLSFTDNMPAGLQVAAPANATTTCSGGTITAVSGSGTISYAGGGVGAGASCTVAVDVTAVSASSFNNTSGDLTSSSGNSGPATDTLTVEPLPVFSKTFGASDLGLNQTTALTLTIDNSGSSLAASALDFTDTLPSGLQVAPTPNASTTCTGGTLTAVANSGTIGYSGGTAAAGTICTVQVDVAPTAVGTHVNTTGDLTSSVGNSGTASASITIAPIPGFAKAFAPNPILLGETTTLTFTVDNTGSVLDATGLDFTDTLPSDLVVGSTPNVVNTCTGGTVTATAGTGVISFSGGTVTAGASCAISVDVTPAVRGDFVNTTGDLTSSLGNSGTASDTLTVNTPEIGISGSIGGAVADGGTLDQGTPDAGAQQSLTLTVSNTGTSPLTLAAAPVISGESNVVVDSVTGPASTTLAIGTSTTIDILYTPATGITNDPTTALPFSFGVSLGNDDVDESPYDVTVSGTAQDVTAPTGYGASFDQDPVNAANQTSASFTFAGAEVGATYAFTITSDGGGIPVSGTGTIATATDQFTGLDLSGLGDGALTLTVALTDPAGNTGGDATDAATKDATIPGLAFDAPIEDDDVVNAAEAPATLISGTSTDLADGAVVTVVVSDGAAGSVTDTTTVTGGLWTITLDLSGLADGALSLTADASDAAGNPAPQATAAATKDTTAPTGYGVSFDQDPVNAANQTSASFTFAGAEVGATYAFTITSDGGGIPVAGTGTIATATDQVTGLDLSGLGDGALTLTVALTDPAGNTGADATDAATKDTDAPGLTIDAPIEDDDVVNAAEAPATVISGTSTDLADGAVVTVVVGDGAAGSVTDTTTVTGSLWTITLDLSGLADGALSVTADASDGAGNPAPQASAAATKDATAPAGYGVSFDQDPVNAANQTSASFTFASAEVGATYAFTITSDGGGIPVAGTGTIATTADQITGLDLSGLNDGALTLTVALTDPAGNTGADATDTATKDTDAPGLTIDAPIEDDDVVNAAEAPATVISGTASGLADGAVVTVVVGDGAAGSVTDTTTVTGGLWTITLDLSGLADGALSLTADASDAAGNPAPQASAAATKDSTAPTGYGVSFDQDPVNAANQTSASFTFAGAEVGASYAFTITSDGGGIPVAGTGNIATATDQVTGLDLSGLNDGTLTLTVALTDPAGNTGGDATDAATKDATIPGLAFDAPIEDDDVVNAAEAPATLISGTSTDLADGAVVTVVVSDGAAGSVTDTTTVTGGLWTITLDLSGLADGALSLTADASDAAGNPAPQASAAATKDATAPAGYTVSFDQDPVNIANASAVSVTFAGAEVGAGYAFTITSDGGGTQVTGAGTVAAATGQFTGLDLSGLNDGTLTISFALTDAVGNTGVDATDTATKDAATPTATLDGPVLPQAYPFTVDLTFSEDVLGLALASLDIDNGSASALTGSGATYSFTVTPDHDGPVEIALLASAATDAAGNPAAAAGPIQVIAVLTGTPNPNPPPDADGDGVPDDLESFLADRDGDGIPDAEDFDPQGYFYCEDDGRIIPGGGFSVSGPAGSNSSLGTANFINITRDGSTGEIQWFALIPGTYTMTLTYPTAVGIPSTARSSSGTLDLTSLLPSNPAVIGSTEVGSTGFLADGSLAANPAFYTGFDIQPGDPFVLANNIPMAQCGDNPVTLSASTNGIEANGGTPTDLTFTVTQARLSTVDTVVSYSVAGSATSGTDFTAPSGTVTIPAGSTSAIVTVPVLEDGVIEGPETVQLTLTALTSGDLTTQLGATLTQTSTITDDDFADIAVNDVDLVTNEGGGDDATMTFALLGTPTAPVTLSFAGDSQCTVTPATLTFTAADYSVPQALTIRAIDDDKVEGTHSCQPTVTVSSADTRYDGAPLALSPVSVTDDLVDQVRDPLTEILEQDLAETMDTQTRAFSRMAKGALQRLQAGRDLPCGTIEAFDVNGSIDIRDATGTARGTFGSDLYNCVTGTREIVDGSFSFNKTEDSSLQAVLQFAFQRERFTGDTALSGYFLGGYASRTDVNGQGDGSINGFGVNGGLYGARGFGQGLFLDYYVAGAAGRHRFDIDFDATPAPISTTGRYDYLGAFAGLGISGRREFDSFVMKPRVGVDFSYARAGDAEVTARQLALTHTGVIDLDDFRGARATAEIRFESLGTPAGSEAMTDMISTAFTPRLACTLSSYEDTAECGLGLNFSWERTDAANGMTWGIEVDLEQLDETKRFTFNISRERPFANGRGAVVTRLSMPGAEALSFEHGVKLDW